MTTAGGYDVEACRVIYRRLRDRVVPSRVAAERYADLERRIAEGSFGRHAAFVQHLQVAFEMDLFLRARSLEDLEKSVAAGPPALALYDAGFDLRGLGPKAAGKKCPTVYGRLLGKIPMPGCLDMVTPGWALVFELMEECPVRPVRGAAFDGELAQPGSRVALPQAAGFGGLAGRNLRTMLDDAPHTYEVWVDVRLAVVRDEVHLAMPEIRVDPAPKTRILSELLTLRAP